MIEPVRESVGKADLGSLSVRESFLSTVKSLRLGTRDVDRSHGETVLRMSLSTDGKYDDLRPPEYVSGLIPGVTGTSGGAINGVSIFSGGGLPTDNILCAIVAMVVYSN